MSPLADLSEPTDEMYEISKVDVWLNIYDREWRIRNIIPDNEPNANRSDSRWSPLYGSFNNFPSMYIDVGTAEILYPDSIAVYNKAKQYNVDVTLHTAQHMLHVYPIFCRFFPEADQSLTKIVQWVKTKI